MNKSFTYEFKDEVRYFKDGKEAIAEIIVVDAPNNKILNEVQTIEMEYKKAEMIRQKKAMAITSALDSKNLEKIIEERRSELQNEKKEKKEETTKHLTAQEILDVLQYGEANMMLCFESLKKILTINFGSRRFAKIDNSENVTSNIFDEMTPRETQLILGEYISTFIIASQNN